MTDIYKMFSTAADLEKEGVWMDFGDFRVCVSRAGKGNDRYVAKMMEVQRKYKQQLQRQTLTPEQHDEALRRVYADCIVTGWRGVTDRNGKKLPFNSDNVFTLFTELPDFFETIREFSENFANFREQELEDTAKNSAPASDGT